MSPLVKSDLRVALYAVAGLFALAGIIREARR